MSSSHPLQEYILIAQDKMSVEQFVRTGANQWTFYRYLQPSDVIPLKAIDCTLSIAEIYAEIELIEK